MSYNEDRAEAIARLEYYLELIDHMKTNVRALHNQGVITDETLGTELAYLAEEYELVEGVLEGLRRRQQS